MLKTPTVSTWNAPQQKTINLQTDKSLPVEQKTFILTMHSMTSLTFTWYWLATKVMTLWQMNFIWSAALRAWMFIFCSKARTSIPLNANKKVQIPSQYRHRIWLDSAISLRVLVCVCVCVHAHVCACMRVWITPEGRYSTSMLSWSVKNMNNLAVLHTITTRLALIDCAWNGLAILKIWSHGCLRM